MSPPAVRPLEPAPIEAMSTWDVLLARTKWNGDCLEWTGTRSNKGYAVIQIGGKQYRVHRLSYTLNRGPVPAELMVCHTCDNPACINPDHLFLGTLGDNNRDRHAKGRDASGDRHASRTYPGRYLPFGERHKHAKLTDEAVTQLRLRYADGVSISQLARQFGVSRKTVRNAIQGKTWSHVQ